MNGLQQYIIDTLKSIERGELENYPDPADPADLGDPLTQEEIDFVKKLKKEMEERFLPL